MWSSPSWPPRFPRNWACPLAVLSGLPGNIVSGGKCSDLGQAISPVAWSRISNCCVQSRSGSGLGFSGLTQGSPGEGSTPVLWASWLAVVLGFLTSATVGWCPSLWPRPFPSVAAVLLRLWTSLTLAHLVSSPFSTVSHHMRDVRVPAHPVLWAR